MKLRRPFEITGIVAAALLSFLSSGFTACAAENIPGNSECGATTKTAIANTEKELASNSADAQGRALRCLVEAVKFLDNAQVIVERGADHHDILHAPQLPGGPGKP